MTDEETVAEILQDTLETLKPLSPNSPWLVETHQWDHRNGIKKTIFAAFVVPTGQKCLMVKADRLSILYDLMKNEMEKDKDIRTPNDV